MAVMLGAVIAAHLALRFGFFFRCRCCGWAMAVMICVNSAAANAARGAHNQQQQQQHMHAHMCGNNILHTFMLIYMGPHKAGGGGVVA